MNEDQSMFVLIYRHRAKWPAGLRHRFKDHSPGGHAKKNLLLVINNTQKCP